MKHGLVNVKDCDKECICENVYEKYIVGTYEFLKSCDYFSAIVRARIPGGCYTNFRDALFHFRKLCRTDEWNELNCQAFAVREHANRAKTDAAITLLRKSASVLGHILREPTVPEELVPVLVEKHDAIRNMEMYIRLDGMMVDDIDAFRPSDQEICNCFGDFSSFCIKNVAGLFRKVMREWPAEDPEHLRR